MKKGTNLTLVSSRWTEGTLLCQQFKVITETLLKGTITYKSRMYTDTNIIMLHVRIIIIYCDCFACTCCIIINTIDVLVYVSNVHDEKARKHICI